MPEQGNVISNYPACWSARRRSTVENYDRGGFSSQRAENAFGSSDCPCQRVPVIDALSWSASRLILQVGVNIIIKLGKMAFHLGSNQTCSMLSFVLYFFLQRFSSSLIVYIVLFTLSFLSNLTFVFTCSFLFFCNLSFSCSILYFDRILFSLSQFIFYILISF